MSKTIEARTVEDIAHLHSCAKNVLTEARRLATVLNPHASPEAHWADVLVILSAAGAEGVVAASADATKGTLGATHLAGGLRLMKDFIQQRAAELLAGFMREGKATL
jgi:hypothetical protein